MWANDPEMAEKWEAEEDEKNEGNIVRITRRQLRQIIKEASGGKGWMFDGQRCNSHNISPDEVAEAMAILGEFGYSLFIPPVVDSNNIAINDALAAYPGEYTYDDFRCAIQIAQGRGA